MSCKSVKQRVISVQAQKRSLNQTEKAEFYCKRNVDYVKGVELVGGMVSTK